MTSTTNALSSALSQSGPSAEIEQYLPTPFEMNESCDNFLTNVDRFAEVDRSLADPQVVPSDAPQNPSVTSNQFVDEELHYAEASVIPTASDRTIGQAVSSDHETIADPLNSIDATKSIDTISTQAS